MQESLVLILSFVDGPGEYPLGVNYQTNAGGIGSIAKTGEDWSTPFSGHAGMVTITTRSDTRLAGTFFFTADGDTGARVVTDGSFDITKPAGLPPLPTGLPSVMTATLDGTEWYAATILAEGPNPSIGGTTTAFAVNIGSKVLSVAAGQTYAIGPDMGLTIDDVDSNDGWEEAGGDSIGFVSITEITEERMTGTFAGTIPPKGTATIPMVVTNGTFSVHFE